jgi:hypothetical protein
LALGYLCSAVCFVTKRRDFYLLIETCLQQFQMESCQPIKRLKDKKKKKKIEAINVRIVTVFEPAYSDSSTWFSVQHLLVPLGTFWY